MAAVGRPSFGHVPHAEFHSLALAAAPGAVRCENSWWLCLSLGGDYAHQIHHCQCCLLCIAACAATQGVQ